MDLTHAHDAMVSDLTRLKKLVKAKDAQIEALSSRIEVLMDDMHEMRSERDAEVMRLRQKDAQLQKELEALALQASSHKEPYFCCALTVCWIKNIPIRKYSGQRYACTLLPQ